MKFFVFFLFCITLGFAHFNNTSYDIKSEQVFKAFEVNTEFLNDKNFLDIKNSFLNEVEGEYLLKAFQNGYEFIPTLREILLKEGIPQEFLYLAMIESGFSLSAKSNKSAMGIWQLMPKTAKALGLEINSQIDERKDPVKSTKAAALYLKGLKEQFGKWYLAAIAYNCGEGRLRKAIKEAQSDSLEVLLDSNKKYLPLESRIYIHKILSLSLFFHNVDILKKKDYDYFLNRGANSNLATIQVAPATPLAKIAKQAGLSLKELKRYNPHFKQNITPTHAKIYSVYLPYQFLANYKAKNLDQENLEAKPYLLYRVHKGDTIYSISKKYGISSKKIIQYNGIENADSLSINQEIVIPLEKG